MSARPSFIGRVLNGALWQLEGIRRTAPERSVRATYGWLLLALFLMSLLINGAGFYFVMDLSAWNDEGSATIAFAKVAVRITGMALVLLASPLLALSLCNLLFPLFGEFTFMAGLRITSPQLARRLEKKQGLKARTSVLISFRRFFIILPIFGACLLLGLVPVVGPLLAPPLSLYFAARTMGWELLDPYFEREGLSWKSQSEEVTRFLPEVLGLGLASLPFLGIPFLGPLFFGMLQSGSALFVTKVFSEPESEARLESEP